MSNWQERAEQERLRQVQEREAKERDLQEQNETRRRELKALEPIIIQRLGIFQELGIPRIFSNLSRDISKGNVSTISDFGGPKVDGKSGKISAALRVEMGWLIGPKTEKVTKRVHVPKGQGTFTNSDARFTEYYDIPAHWAEIEVGDRIIGVGDVPIGHDQPWATLSYNLDSDRYDLEVIKQKSTFDRPSIDMAELKGFVDRACLNFAMSPLGEVTRNFEAARREEQRRRSKIQANIGRLTKDVGMSWDFRSEWTL